MQNKQFEVVLFDLGGVLIELTGMARMLDWTNHALTVDELWHRWLNSPSVRLFEAGRCTADEFAASVCNEFELPVTGSIFLQEFYWALRPYPGASALLRKLSSHFTLASLSNTNVIHWKYICETMGLVEHFHVNFPSHEIGMVKPEREIFEFVVASLGCSPERILFLDDNQLNVEQAQEVGLVAHRVRGFEDTVAKLAELGIRER